MEKRPAEKKEKKSEEKPTPPAEKKESVAELKELLQRTQASFENYRKQVEKRMEEIQKKAARGIIQQILPIIDNFELALKSEEKNPLDFRQGMELIYSQLFSLLEENGVQPINTEKAVFDPYFHEALMKVESDRPEKTILEEFQKGFVLQGEVIRHAKVKVSAGKAVKKGPGESEENRSPYHDDTPQNNNHLNNHQNKEELK